MRRLTVYVDEVPLEVLASTEVSGLVGFLAPDRQLALKNGLAYFADAKGHEIGSGGGLKDRQHLFVVYRA